MEVLSRAARNKLISKIWRANNPDKIRNKNYKDRYGITLDDYNAMLKKQKNRCYLCGSHNDDTKLYVDHCHTKKTVRKLLCQYCNSGLGQFRDNVKVMKKAIEYLKQFK
ncbi:recombination endonuclease [Methylophilales phage Venkman EXVC282S]|nr:recombination endonuclease [Methylophilales phage Venkman EXVC282S]